MSEKRHLTDEQWIEVMSASTVLGDPPLMTLMARELLRLRAEVEELREQIETGQVQLMSLMDDDLVDLEWQKRRDKDAELGANLRAMVRRYGVRHLLRLRWQTGIESFVMPLVPNTLDETVAEAAKAGGDDA